MKLILTYNWTNNNNASRFFRFKKSYDLEDHEHHPEATETTETLPKKIDIEGKTFIVKPYDKKGNPIILKSSNLWNLFMNLLILKS